MVVIQRRRWRLHGTTETRRWFDAAIPPAEDPASEVACPVCRRAALLVTVIPPPVEHEDTYLRCSSCSAYQVLTGRAKLRPDQA